MKHPLHELLLAAAEDEEAMFETPEGCAKGRSHGIALVMRYPNLDWKLVEKPNPQTETRWQWRTEIGNCCTTGWFAIAPNDYYCIKLEYTAQEFEMTE